MSSVAEPTRPGLRRWAWPVMTAVFVAALAVGVWPHGSTPRTNEARAQHLAQQVRCPTCAGLSAAESDSPLAQSSRDEIAKRVSAGQTDAQIKDFFVSRYGPTALMSPEREGLTGIAWWLPAVAGGAAVIGLVLAVQSWTRRRSTDDGPTDDDRALVRRAMRGGA